MSNLYLQPGNREVRTIEGQKDDAKPPEGYKFVLIPYTDIEMMVRKDNRKAHVQTVAKRKLTEKPVRQDKRTLEHYR